MASVADQCTKPGVLEMLGFGTRRLNVCYERFTTHPVKVLPTSFCRDVHKSENAQTMDQYYSTNAILSNTNYFFLNFNFSTATHRRSERLTSS